MHHLIYSSTATHPFTDNELQELLTYARLHNAQQNITGLLLYHNREFMQLLEGNEADIKALYDRISEDSRHTSVVKIADKHVEHRSFPDWSMAFVPLEAEQFAQLAGYLSPANLQLTRDGLSAADSLLLNLMQTYMLSSSK
ncbi:BLUF domain-containing protein [Hymenobacter seoulensis]